MHGRDRGHGSHRGGHAQSPHRRDGGNGDDLQGYRWGSASSNFNHCSFINNKI